jgi:hypothetical protein
LDGANGTPILLSSLVIELEENAGLVTCEFDPFASPSTVPTCTGSGGGTIQQFNPSEELPEYWIRFTGKQQPRFVSVAVIQGDDEVARFDSGWLDYHETEATRCHDACRATTVGFAMPQAP